MMKANELQETKTLVDIDDTYPEEIVVEGEGGFEYGLSREEERGLIGFIRNLTSPTRREVIKPEKTIYRQKVDAPAGEYTKEYIPAEYGEEEVSLDYAPAVRGTRAAFEYAKSLFGSQETRDEAIAALKQAPAVVEKSMKDQMTAALGMTQGAESVVTREGEEITFDPLAVPATMVPGGIAARAAATEGSTVLGIFGGSKGKSFAEREAAFEKAVNDGLKDEADLPDAWKGDEYLSKMFLDQDVFEKSGGAFRAEDGILKYEIPTRNVKLKTIKEGGVFDNIGGVKIPGSPIDDDTVVFSEFLFAELQNKKIKEVLDNPEKFAGIQTQAGYTYSTQDVIDRTRTTPDMSENDKRIFRENVTDFLNPVVIQDVLDFPELFDEYPALAKIKFRVEDLPPGSGAYYNPLDESGGQAIVVDRQTIAKKEVIKSILHELQHAVDHVEDRQFGASVQAYLPRNASGELERLAVNTRIHTQTLEGMFPPEKFGNLYPDVNNYKALRGLSHEDARTLDIIHKLNSPELIEEMRARNPNPESHAGKLIEAYDSMDDMQRIIFDVYDKEYDKYKQLTEIYEEAQRKYLSTPGEVDARNVEDRFDNPDQQVGGDSPVLPTLFKDTDDMGRTIHKDMSLTGGEDVDDIAFKSASNRTTKAPLRKLLDKLPQKEIDELPKQPDNNRIFGYHGTARERKPDEPFFDIGFARKNDQFLGEGFYFTLDPKVAEEYANLRAFRDFDVGPIQKGKDPVLTHRETGKKTTVANLQKGLDIEGNPLTMGQSVSRFDLSNIEKPYVVRTEKQRKELKAKIPQLKEEGYDAVLFADFKDRSKQIMVFPEHINKIDTSSMAGRTKSYKSEPAQTEADRIQIRAEGGPEAGTPEAIAEEKALNAAIADAKTKNDGEQYKEFFEEEAAVNYLVELPDNKKAQAKKDWDEVKTVEQVDNWFKKYDAEPDTVEAVGMSDKDIDTWRKENATSEDFRKRLKGRSETLQNLAAGVKAGDVTRAEYREAANAFRPIREVSQVPEPATPIEMVSALNKGQRQKGIVGVNKTIPDGDRITARLDINAYTDYDVWIPTLTHPELKTVYSSTVVMKNVRFIQPEDRAVKQAMDVATGKPKAPFAVMEGDYMDMSAEDAYSLARESFDSNEWTQVGYDPTKRGFFYNRSTGEPVLNADEVIQVGHLVLAKNAKMGKAEDFAFKRGGLMARK